jgi:hypothetical protein
MEGSNRRFRANALELDAKWPTHIFTKWPFCTGHLQNTLRGYADKTEVAPMKLRLSAALCALPFAGASLIGGYAQPARSLANVISTATLTINL